jgi:Ca2+-binding RTX toxin-like protein
VIWGRGDGDYLSGGSGRDVFRYAAASESAPGQYDMIVDFATGTDKIDLSAMAPSNVSITRYNGGALINGGSAGGAFQIATLDAVNGSDILGLTGGIYLVGENFVSTLIGGAGGDTVKGGAANDTIVGGGDGDALFGGAGSNTFRYVAATDSSNANLDIIHDFKAGVDTLDLTALAPSNVSILHYNGGTFVNGGSGATAFQIASVNSINGSDIQGLVNGVYLVGENVASSLVGSAKDDTIVGGSGNDTITGGGAGDALFGGGGADTFMFHGAEDSNGAAGMLDIIHDFQTGVDSLSLGSGVSNISVIRYNGGTFIFGNSPTGVFEIASTQDINAADIHGLINGAYLAGDDHSQTLIGGFPGETIRGGAAADVIIGGGGADALFGGGGADVFKYLNAWDSAPGVSDIIHDFQAGVDKIDLTAIHTSASDKYALISDAGASYLFVQLAGNPGNDMQILIANPNVHASDILW